MQRLTGIIHTPAFFAILSFIIPLGVYLLTLAPSVTFFDSGEFLTAIYSMGSAHSPGYPAFINYARPFIFLPFGSVAFKINFATATAGALACLSLYVLARHVLISILNENSSDYQKILAESAALAASLSFAFSSRLWLQSNHDKPYPLVAFISAVVLWFIIRWREHYLSGCEKPAYIYAGAFLSGFTFAAHQTIILMVPVYASILLVTEWKLILRFRELLVAVAAAFAGFGIHLHLVVRSAQKPLLNWGDPSSLSQFVWHLLRKGYPVEKPARDLNLIKDQINAFNVPHEFTIAGMFLLFIGLIYLWQKQRHIVVGYAVGLAAFLLMIAGYLNTPKDLIFLTEEFFTPMYLFSALIISAGLFAIGSSVYEYAPDSAFKGKLLFILSFAMFVFPSAICALHYPENDQHENYIAHDYATNSLRSLPKGAILYTWGDSGAFPLWYLQGVERMREDVDLLHTPHLVFNWYLESFPHVFRDSRLKFAPLDQISPETALLMHVDELMGKRPLFIDFSSRYSVPLAGLQIKQNGIIYEIASKGEGTSLLPERNVWKNYSFRGMSGEMFFRDLDTSKAILIYGSSYLEEGETLLRYGMRAEALASLKAAMTVTPELSGQIYQVLAPYNIRLW